MYKLNKKNPIVKKLMELDYVISDYYASKCYNPESRPAGNISEIVNSGKELDAEIANYVGNDDQRADLKKTESTKLIA
jgi:hypothetical protein